MNNYNDYYNYLNGYMRSSINGSVSGNSYDDKGYYGFDIEPYVGFMRGNMFDGLYSSYRNYRPYEVNPSNEMEYALFLIQMYGFSAHDLNLYLDVYPNDSSAIALRSKYVKLYNQALMDYESKYGPLDLNSDYLSSSPWAWDSKNWPWEGNK